MLVEMLPLVKRVAFQIREHLPAHVEVDDLLANGVLGLVDAVAKFDTTKRVKLESYARHRVRGGILDGLRSADPASRDLRRKNKKIQKLYRGEHQRILADLVHCGQRGAQGTAVGTSARRLGQGAPDRVPGLRARAAGGQPRRSQGLPVIAAGVRVQDRVEPPALGCDVPGQELVASAAPRAWATA